MRKTVVLFTLLAAVATSCTKEDVVTDPLPGIPYDSLDIGIRFTHYVPGIVYVTDTIQNEFELQNHSLYTLKKGDVFKTACRIQGILFALDLIGEGPTDIKLPHDLAPGETYVYNPGYLLGQSLLDYFGSDTISICVMVYGVNDTIISQSFDGDPLPQNNMACLRFYSGGLQLE